MNIAVVQTVFSITVRFDVSHPNPAAIILNNN